MGLLPLTAALMLFMPPPLHRPAQNARAPPCMAIIGVPWGQVSDAIPAILGSGIVATALLGAAVALEGNEAVDEFDRTRASKIPKIPPPLELPTPRKTLTPEAEALTPLLGSPREFQAAFQEAVLHLGVRGAAANAPATSGASLQARIAAVRSLSQHRTALAECLTVAVESSFAEAKLSLLPTIETIAPGAALPPTAVTLVRAAQQFPGQSARQKRGFVTESAPSNE